ICVKRVMVLTALTVVVFLICFALVWNTGQALAHIVPSLQAAVAALTLAISLALTAGVVQKILSLRRR
ncbi:MAG TPA: hypothetical protein VM029_05360, partial [Opitutaceae bacterium]|nr:hypothetical protein [Opitutaceae bacterium]